MLAQRAVADSPRWTRAVEDQSAPIPGENEHAWRREGRLKGLLCSCNARSQKPLARANGTSRRASGWEGEKAARSGDPLARPQGGKMEERCSFGTGGGGQRDFLLPLGFV